MDWNNVVSSDEEDVEGRGQEHHVQVCREQDMFHQEQCEVERTRSNMDTFGRMRRKDSSPPFQWEGHRRFERRIAFLSRARVKGTDIERSGWMF